MTSPTADGQGWRPIETAPVRPYDPDRWFSAHSERMLLLVGGHVTIGTYHYTRPRGKSPAKGKWRDGYGDRVLSEPSHWMPLPSPPTSGETQ